MTTSSGSNNDQSNHESSGYCCGNWGKGGNWSGFNIAAMVLGFIVFWPIGLFLMFWNMSGRSIKAIPEGFRHFKSKVTGGWKSSDWDNVVDVSDNVVFNEYQETQSDRIREIKEEMKNRSRRFSAYREEAKRRADEEEFNRFMSDAPGRSV